MKDNSISWHRDETAPFTVASASTSASVIPHWLLILSGYRNNSDGSLNNVGSNGYVWLSSANSQNNAYNLNFNSSNVNPQNNNNRANGFSVRPVQAFAKEAEILSLLYVMDLTRNELDRLLTLAYLDARQNERTKNAQLSFELNMEDNLRVLREELWKREYKPSPPMCFVIDTPREVFAPLFRDRIVSHLLFNMIAPLFDPLFIYDSYSCRKGKGTMKGIVRMEHYIRSCTENFTKRAYVLCLDISGYFMNINKGILYRILCEEMHKHKNKWENFIDYSFVDYLIRVILFRTPTEGCAKIGKLSNWDKLPPHKSLFNSPIGSGLTIGDVTSQLFSNIYLNPADQFAKRELHCKHYGRYVDDIRIVHHNKEALERIAYKIDRYLKQNLSLRLNPNKTRIIRADKTVDFLGANVCKFNRYASDRTLVKFAEKSKDWTGENLSSANSYLSYLKHFKADKVITSVIGTKHIPESWEYDSNKCKMIIKNSDYEEVPSDMGLESSPV